MQIIYAMIRSTANTLRAASHASALLTALRRVGLVLVLTGSCAQAAWTDLKEGQAPKEVASQVGAPLMHTRSRSGATEMWVYDDGGHVIFESGHVRFWQAPKSKKSTGTASAVAVAAVPPVMAPLAAQ